MSVEKALETAAALLTPWAQSTSSPEPCRLDVVVTIASLHSAIAALQGANWGRLSAITGLDLVAPPAAEKPARPAGAAARPVPAGAAARPAPAAPGAKPPGTAAPARAVPAASPRPPAATATASVTPPVRPAVPAKPAAPPALPTTDLEVLYHFCEGAAIVTLRVRVPRAKPELPTICGIVPYAGFYESELSELFGITVVGTPSTDHLILPDDWPADTYPLRKDAVLPKPPVYRTDS